MPDIAIAWYWLAGGIVIAIAEMLVPGFYMLWLGLAAVETGVVVFALPKLSLEWQGAIFAVAAVLNCIVGRVIYRRSLGPTDHPMLNRRADQYIGQTFVLTGDVADERATIRVGDTTWNVVVRDGAALRSGDHVRVVGSDGALLVVEPAAR